VWNVSASTITRIFRNEPGVLKIGPDKPRQGRRVHTTLTHSRIRASAGASPVDRATGLAAVRRAERGTKRSWVSCRQSPDRGADYPGQAPGPDLAGIVDAAVAVGWI
jgi:hypothetical protein